MNRSPVFKRNLLNKLYISLGRILHFNNNYVLTIKDISESELYCEFMCLYGATNDFLFYLNKGRDSGLAVSDSSCFDMLYNCMVDLASLVDSDNIAGAIARELIFIIISEHKHINPSDSLISTFLAVLKDKHDFNDKFILLFRSQCDDRGLSFLDRAYIWFNEKLVLELLSSELFSLRDLLRVNPKVLELTCIRVLHDSILARKIEELKESNARLAALASRSSTYTIRDESAEESKEPEHSDSPKVSSSSPKP